ncbi:MAG TPA: mandelate racemase/muconate lactonizing enzyme family protein, partial [Chloroflexota bacterium]|nr:mandelate racemase/muconate lactonizing enzyme family protein [Chloroflexota bacterium]
MQITNVRTATVAIPVKRPTAISTRSLAIREFVLVWLESDVGVEGLGYTYAGTNGGRVVQMCVDTILARLVVGQDPRYTELIWDRMFKESLLVGRRGGTLRAIAAVDLALWDLLGKIHDEPLYRLLGAYRDQVPAYASGGYYRPDIDPLDEVVGEMGRYLDRGFVDFKIKVGGRSIHEDRERVRVARETIGPRARLALDANNAYNDVATAVRAAEAFASYDIWWFEEPTYPDSLPNSARIASRVPMPVATGEIEGTRWGFRDIIASEAAQILQPDAVVLGGISEWLKVAHLAAAHDYPVAPHWNANVHAHLVAAVANGLTVEYFHLDEDIYNFERLIDPENRLQVKAGLIDVPRRPGIGVVLNNEVVEQFRIG